MPTNESKPVEGEVVDSPLPRGTDGSVQSTAIKFIGAVRAFPIWPLLLVLITNLLQWALSSAEIQKLIAERDTIVVERDKTIAEIGLLRQNQSEGESRAAFALVQELRLSSSSDEQKVQVLTIALATTPYEKIREWIKVELETLRARIQQRQLLAETSASATIQDASRDETSLAPPSGATMSAPTKNASSVLRRSQEALNTIGEACARPTVYPAAFVPDPLGGQARAQTDAGNIADARLACMEQREGAAKKWTIVHAGFKWNCECL